MLFLYSGLVASQDVTGITSSSPDLINYSFKIIIFLALLLAGFVAINRLTKDIPRKRARMAKERLITVLAHERIGLKNYISLVEVPGYLLVVGVTNEGISLLTKIKNEKVPDDLQRHYTDARETSFLDQLRRVTPGQRKNDVIKSAFSIISRLRIKTSLSQKAWVNNGSAQGMANLDK